MRLHRPLLPLVFLLLLLGACDTEQEAIPAFIQLQPFIVEPTNMAVHGSVSSKITHGKVFLRDLQTGLTHQLGTLALPGSYPVLLEGQYELVVDPVIKANGNSFSALIYPFYERFSTVVNLEPNVETTVTPRTRYRSDAVFEFIEGFESPVLVFSDDRDENPLTFIERSNADVFEGNYSGHVHLDTANHTMVVSTKSPFTLDVAQQGRIFLELDYKTDVQLELGVIAVDAVGSEEPNFSFVVLEKEEWNKIYFDLTELVSTANTDRFFIVIRALLSNQTHDPPLTEADVWFDNIKLVHF